MGQHYVLIINVGSTSVKSQLFDVHLQTLSVLNADYGSREGLLLNGQNTLGLTISKKFTDVYDARATLRVVLEHWQQWLLDAHWTLSAIGHRVVHGGAEFKCITPITHDVLKRIADLNAYAPLHNPLNHLGVTMAGKVFPDTPQFAVFDTAFHRHIPTFAGRYAIPENLSANVQFYRYGFHGISCQHSVRATAKLLNTDPDQLNLIILHLGGGASITAVRHGVSVDTSMGFSPTEGLMMASRSGDLDCMIPLTLQREGMAYEQVDELLNHHSGLRGICGETDMRIILQHAEQQQPDALLALDMFCYRIKKYIGAYCAILENVSALVFTGGIGEHAPKIREAILHNLSHLGFSLDSSANATKTSNQQIISCPNSPSAILVIPAAEELEIARQIITFVHTQSPPE